MNILTFAPYYPPHVGGVESYMSELNSRLVESGYALTVFAPHFPASAPEEEHKNGIHIIRYPAFEIIPNYPLPKFWRRAFFMSSKKLKQKRFDIAISHTRFFFSSLLALRFSISKNMPLIHIEHGSSFVQNSNWIISILAYFYDRLIGKRILSKATHVVAISDSVKIFVENLTHGQVRPTVIYRGFDWQSYDAIEIDDSKWLTRNETTVRIIYIGRLTSGKGVTDLITALNLIKDKPWQCLIVGDGPERKRLQSLCDESGIADKVSFLGILPHKEALSVLRSAHIFVNPSHTEGLPTTVIEATIFNKSIVATDVGGTREISSSIALVPTKNPRALSDQIVTALLAHANRKPVQNEAKNLKRKFSAEKSITEFIKILKTLAT